MQPLSGAIQFVMDQSLIDPFYLSRIHLLISKISHVCQEIHDIKGRQKTPSIGKTNTNTIMDREQTNPNYTLEQDNNSSAKEGNNDEGGWDEIYSSRSKQCHHAPSNLNTPSHHAPVPPSPNPTLSESILEPPGDLSPSPASRIVTSTPFLLV